MLQCIYIPLPAFCLPSFSRLIYVHCLSAPSHCSLNLGIMCSSLRRLSIYGASVQPEGLPSSSSIFPAMLVRIFGSGAATHVPLVVPVLPPWTPTSSSQKPFVLGCSQTSGGSAWFIYPGGAWGGFKVMIRVHCTQKNSYYLTLSTTESCFAILMFEQILCINFAGKLFLFYTLGTGRGGLCSFAD